MRLSLAGLCFVLRLGARASDLPNPCTQLEGGGGGGKAFLTPIYKVSNFSIRLIQSVSNYPRFEITDQANNYTVPCFWVLDRGRDYSQDPPDQSPVLCDPQVLQGYPAASAWYSIKKNSVDIAQEWVCDAKNGSYPTLIFANATINFTAPLSCINNGNSSTDKSCTLANKDLGPSVTATVKWPSPPKVPDRSRWVPQNSGKNELASVPDNDTPCIGLSFSYPNWDVIGLFYSPDSKSANFELRNHASNVSVPCTSPNTKKARITCQDGPTTKTDGELDRTSGELRVDQTWSCPVPGENQTISFRASGTTSVAVASRDTSSIQIIRGALSQPLSLKPSLSIPTASQPNCRKLSEQGPSFDLHVWSSQKSYGMYTGSGNTGNIAFDLINKANGLTMLCEASGPELNNCTKTDAPKWFDCLPADVGQFGAGQSVATRFTYNSSNNEIVLNHTWYCNEDEAHPVRFNAIVEPGPLPMQCEVTDNSAWPGKPPFSDEYRCSAPQRWLQNTIVEIQCNMNGSTTYKPTKSPSSVELPPYSISERKPTGQSCTIASALAPRWLINDLVMSTYWSSMRTGYTAPWTSIGVAIQTTGHPGKIIYPGAEGRELIPYQEQTKAGTWYPCSTYGYDKMIKVDCSWQVDFEQGYVALNHSWMCNDKDTAKPILFQAVGSARFNMTCAYDYSHNNNGSHIWCGGKLEPSIIYPTTITNNSTLPSGWS